jgi:predicted site-specific integrase-resolvase
LEKLSLIVVEHPYRRARFGAEYRASRCLRSQLVVIDPAQIKDELIADMINGLVSFGARIHGGQQSNKTPSPLLPSRLMMDALRHQIAL